MATKYGTRLKMARAHAKLTQNQASRLTGIAQSTISTAEREGYGSADTPVYARIYGVDVHWLATGDGEMLTGNSSNITPVQIGARRIPLINYVQAGLWTGVVDSYTPGHAEDWLLTDLELPGNAFALEIKGDSMLPEFKPGDRVIIDPTIAPRPGDYVVAKNGKEEATFKKYRPRGIGARGEDVFELVPLNEDYASIRSDHDPVRIVGVMVEHRKYRRR